MTRALPRHQLPLSARDYLAMLPALLRPEVHRHQTGEFERRFADYVGVRNAIAVSSGRLGLHLLIEALSPRPGDEVIAAAFNLSAVIERFCQFGLIPRFADISSDDLCLDPASVQTRITPKTRILLATHMFGHPADMERLRQLALDHDLHLIEDCAHALGTRVCGRHVGTFGAAAIFSFSVLKLVTTLGGGMIVTNDDVLAAKIRRRLHELAQGFSLPVSTKKLISGALLDLATRHFSFTLATWPALRLLRWIRPDMQQRLLTEIPRVDRSFNPAHRPAFQPMQSLLGLRQLAMADRLIQSRRNIATWLDRELERIPHLQLLHSRTGGRWNGLYYGVLCERSLELAEHLFRHGIDVETSEYRDCAGLSIYGGSQHACPVSHQVESRILRIPNLPSMTQADVVHIAGLIRQFYAAPLACKKKNPASVTRDSSPRTALAHH